MKTRLFEVDSEGRRRVVEQLTDELCKDARLLFAYVHGSFQAGDPFHDIDVAVYLSATDRVSQRLDLADWLSRLTGYPVDLRVLNDAPVSFQFKALQGTLLVSRDDGRLAEFMERVGPRYLDIEPILRRATREAFVRWPLTPISSVRAVARLKKSVTRLSQIAGMPKERFLADRDILDIACYRLLVAIESALALCYHVSARRLRRTPEDYAACFGVLREAGLVPAELTERLQQMARFRNLLVHIYWKLEYGQVYDILQRNLGDLRQFASIVAALS